MKKGMKRILSISIGVLLLLNLVACGGSKKGGVVGETYTTNTVEFTLNHIKFTEVIDGWEGANDNYWLPLEEDTYEAGRYSYEEYVTKYGLKAKSDDEMILSISYTVKNIAKKDVTVDEIGVLDYDNGYEYSEGGLTWRQNEDSVWTDIPSGVTLKQLKENEYELRAYLIVPKEVTETEKTLTYTLFGIEYDLREQ